MNDFADKCLWKQTAMSALPLRKGKGKEKHADEKKKIEKSATNKDCPTFALFLCFSW